MSKSIVEKMLGNAELAHHGVKGMRWGFSLSNVGKPSGVSVKTKTGPLHTRIKTRGGTHQPANADAVATALLKQKLKRSGPNSLSNTELQHLALRLNLEQQVSRLRENDMGPGRRFVKSIVRNVAKDQATKVANDAASQQVAALLAKRTAVAAVA